MSGFYLMYRGWQDHPVFRNAEYSVRDAFEWLIGAAVFQDCTTYINGKSVTLKRGQLSYSIRFLAQKWRRDKARVNRYVSLLSRCEIIDTATETGQLVITICNYDKYQAPQDTTETAIDTPSRQQRDRSETNKNNDNNDKESKRGTRFENSGVESLSDEWREVCKQLRPDLDPQQTFERFKDFWLSKAGPAGVKRNWLATWRNWVRNERAFEGKPKETAQIHKLLTESDLTARGKRRVFGRDAELYAEEQNWPRKPRPFADVPMDWQPRRQA